MTHIKQILISYFVKHAQFYCRGQELHLSPRAKEQILTSVWQTVQSELHQEFKFNK